MFDMMGCYLANYGRSASHSDENTAAYSKPRGRLLARLVCLALKYGDRQMYPMDVDILGALFDRMYIGLGKAHWQGGAHRCDSLKSHFMIS